MQKVAGETRRPSGFSSVKLNGVFIVFSIPLYQRCPALWSREHTHSFIRSSSGNCQPFVRLCVGLSMLLQASFTPRTLLEGLIQRNPIRLSSFPPTAILALLAQTWGRYSISNVVPLLPFCLQSERLCLYATKHLILHRGSNDVKVLKNHPKFKPKFKRCMARQACRLMQLLSVFFF